MIDGDVNAISTETGKLINEITKEEIYMGWTSHHATHYKNGKVDRKAECDAYFEEGLNQGYYQVLKSSLVGSVYYAAVQHLKRYVTRDGERCEENIPEAERTTFAAVFLTRVDNFDYFNFSYKDMDESVGPIEDKCPASILDLLSPTDHEGSLDWRMRCRRNNAMKKSPNTLRNLPIGAKIQFMQGNQIIMLEKHAPGYQFKRPFWYNAQDNCHIPAKHIPKEYRVLTEEKSIGN